MPKIHRESEGRRREEIRTAAKKLFYLYGFSATSMDLIASEAGISKGLIYHYFGGKEDLLLSFSGDVDNYLRDLEKMPSYEALRRFGIDFLVCEKEKYSTAPPIQILLTTFANGEVNAEKYASQNPILRDFGRDFLGTLFKKGIDADVFKPGNSKIFGDIYWSYLMGKLLPLKKGNEREAPEKYVDEILGVFM